MAETTEETEQGETVEELTERIEVLEKNDKETWGMLGQLIDYINVTAEQRSEQLRQILKEIYESKLAERYNTAQLQDHRLNREVHYSDKKGRTYLYD